VTPGWWFSSWIVDPTLWCYRKDVEGVWVGTYGDGIHRPHGKGSIWKWGRPVAALPGQELELTPAEPWSGAAEDFLRLLGPLDRRGWAQLAHAPVEGWPAGEILAGMAEWLSQVRYDASRTQLQSAAHHSGPQPRPRCTSR
jgi:hypothetical protein